MRVLDTGSFPANTEALRRRIEGGELPGPAIMMASGSLVPVGGSPYYILPARLPEALSVPVVVAMAEATLDREAEGIKLFTGASAAPRSIVVMPIELVRAASSLRGAYTTIRLARAVAHGTPIGRSPSDAIECGSGGRVEDC